MSDHLTAWRQKRIACYIIYNFFQKVDKTEVENVTQDVSVKHKKKRNRRADAEQHISENVFVEVI